MLLDLVWLALSVCFSAGGEGGGVGAVENHCNSCPCELPPTKGSPMEVTGATAVRVAVTVGFAVSWTLILVLLRRSSGYERENVALRTKVKAQRRLLRAEEARKADLGGLFSQLRKTQAQLTALVSGIGNFNVGADDADGVATGSISAAAVGATATTDGNTAIPAGAAATAADSITTAAEGSTAKAGHMTVDTPVTSHHSSTAAAVDETATAAATNPKLVIRQPRLAAAGEIVTGIDTPTAAVPRFVIKRPRSAAATGKSSTGIATPAAPGRSATADATAATTTTTTTSARGKATRADRFRKFYRNFHWWATARKSTMATPDDN
uniref:Mucin-19-like n=1 Tax=Petromyzon marinus TaxID=7757 RepID=A0AAJ7UEA8_PETMA|nr:mucin-19-like [Petromyzon marinus]